MRYYGVFVRNKLVAFSENKNMVMVIINALVKKGHNVGLRDVLI